jgi:hypothetical protein
VRLSYKLILKIISVAIKGYLKNTIKLLDFCFYKWQKHKKQVRLIFFPNKFDDTGEHSQSIYYYLENTLLDIYDQAKYQTVLKRVGRGG